MATAHSRCAYRPRELAFMAHPPPPGACHFGLGGEFRLHPTCARDPTPRNTGQGECVRAGTTNTAPAHGCPGGVSDATARAHPVPRTISSEVETTGVAGDQVHHLRLKPGWVRVHPAPPFPPPNRPASRPPPPSCAPPIPPPPTPPSDPSRWMGRARALWPSWSGCSRPASSRPCTK